MSKIVRAPAHRVHHRSLHWPPYGSPVRLSRRQYDSAADVVLSTGRPRRLECSQRILACLHGAHAPPSFWGLHLKVCFMPIFLVSFFAVVMTGRHFSFSPEALVPTYQGRGHDSKQGNSFPSTKGNLARQLNLDTLRTKLEQQHPQPRNPGFHALVFSTRRRGHLCLLDMQ